MKAESYTSGGLKVTWGAEHCDGEGNLISRQASISTPIPPNCIRLSCLLKYVIDSIRYALICIYHERRTAYAEANRHKKILERYRTGEPSPETIWQAIHALTKITCPVCRKYNKDPLLFRRNYEKGIG